MRRVVAWLLALFLLTGARLALADTRIWMFSESAPPQELRDTALAVVDEDVVMRLTFAGDCTLGDEARVQGGRNGFRATVRREGADYPFAKLKALFSADDFTIVNLEGVLTDSAEDRQRKQYNFRGGTELANVLTQGDIECAGLCNNHIRDYGVRGERDTKAALDAAGIAYFDQSTLCVLEKGGVRVGVTCSLFQLDEKRLARQTALLTELGCAATVHVMHAGKEYRLSANRAQEAIAGAAAGLGAALVVGHHPHIVQNVELVSGVPVVYSMGNCCFGGNLNPDDKTALLVGAELRFQSGALSQTGWTLYPISVSGAEGRNDFQPYLLTGEKAQRVMERVQAVSGTALKPYQQGLGAIQDDILHQ